MATTTHTAVGKYTVSATAAEAYKHTYVVKRRNKAANLLPVLRDAHYDVDSDCHCGIGQRRCH